MPKQFWNCSTTQNWRTKTTQNTTLPIQFFSFSPSETSRGIRHSSFPSPSEAVLKNANSIRWRKWDRNLVWQQVCKKMHYLVAEEARWRPSTWQLFHKDIDTNLREHQPEQFSRQWVRVTVRVHHFELDMILQRHWVQLLNTMHNQFVIVT